MKCKLCGKKTTEYKKLKNGIICSDCLELVRSLFADHDETLRHLTDKQFKHAKRIITTPKHPWFGSIDGIKVGIDAMQVNDWEIQYRHIQNIELTFHPKEYGTGKLHAKGNIGIKIETNHPHIIFEDIVIENTDVEYRIGGREIHYIYPRGISGIVEEIMSIILNKTYNMKDFYDRRQAYKTKEKQKEKQETEFDKAKKMFGVEIPYTQEVLKLIRNQLVIENHPDHGGSTEKCAEINRAYDLLVRFATK